MISRVALGFALVLALAAVIFLGSGIFSADTQAGSSVVVVLRHEGESVPVFGDGSSVVTIVSDTESAKAAIGESTRGLVLTEQALYETDAEWVRGEVERGVVLGGINVWTNELRQAFDVINPLTLSDGRPISPAGTEKEFDTGGQPFFTLLYEVKGDDGRVSRGGTTGLLTDEDAFLRQINRMFEAVQLRENSDGS